uniref:pectinesterase n=1 Tax=Kalanchoe fedtschenkoi TaxID=63787 RepID=A0A7N0TS79_KALFE
MRRRMSLLVLLLEVNMLGMECSRNYITWNDLTVVNRSRSKVIVVADRNGRGDSRTVQGAVDKVPDNNTERVKILIHPGIYREKVVIPKSKPYISFIGIENKTSETVISWHDKASDKDKNGRGIGLVGTATVTIESDYFCANGITFENTVKQYPGAYNMQAAALRVVGDKAMFYKVRILGVQDTLLDQEGTHYYYRAFIQGRVDFICGNAKSLFKKCMLHSIAEAGGAIAAHHRNSLNEDTGFSFVDCTINGKGPTLLGRAWGSYSRTIYSRCYMDNIISPVGWSYWNDSNRKRTTDFGEFRCKGKGADRHSRAPWSKSLTYNDAKPFLSLSYINDGNWLRL